TLRTITPLFFFDASRRQSLNVDLQDPLFESIEHAATNLKMRIATFARANRASPEADLAALGLADSDNNAWRRVADAFVWGSYSVTNSAERGAMTLNANLWVWHHGRISNIT